MTSTMQFSTFGQHQVNVSCWLSFILNIHDMSQNNEFTKYIQVISGTAKDDLKSEMIHIRKTPVQTHKKAFQIQLEMMNWERGKGTLTLSVV